MSSEDLTKEQKLLRNISASISVIKGWIVASYELWESEVDDTKKLNKLREINTLFKCLNTLVDSMVHSDNELVETAVFDEKVETKFNEIRSSIGFIEEIQVKEMMDVYKNIIGDTLSPAL